MCRRADPGPVRSQREVLRGVAFAWALIAVVGLVVASRLGLLHHRPGGDAYEIRQQQIVVVVFLVVIMISRKWEVIGGTLALLAAAAVVVFAARLLEPLDAVVVAGAFLVPGLLWTLIYLHDLPPRRAVAAMVVIVPAVTVGGFFARRVYDDLYGPAHPSSELAELPDSEVEWIWSGGVTESSAVVVAKLDVAVDGVLLAVSDDEAFTDSVWFEPTEVNDRVVRFELDSLTPDIGYHYAVEVEGTLDTVRAGRFRTFPSGPASFTIAAASCMRVGTNGAVFDTIRELDPLVFLQMGDFHYANIGDDDPDAFRRVLDLQLTRAAPSALFRSTPIGYVWDDHDFGDNNSDATSPSRPAAMEVYRDYVPHYPLLGSQSPIAQAFTIGRMRVIMTDSRSGRSPSGEPDDADKTMLGDEQRAWFESELLASARSVSTDPVGELRAVDRSRRPWRGRLERLLDRAGRNRRFHRSQRHRGARDGERRRSHDGTRRRDEQRLLDGRRRWFSGTPRRRARPPRQHQGRPLQPRGVPRCRPVRPDRGHR